MTGNRINVLIVDDQPHVRKGLQALLTTSENIVITGFAANGIQAIELALELQPDVILLDAHMPHLDGFEAAQSIQASVPAAKIVLMDTREDPQFQQRMHDADLYPYILKNQPDADLILLIERLVCGKTGFIQEVENEPAS